MVTLNSTSCGHHRGHKSLAGCTTALMWQGTLHVLMLHQSVAFSPTKHNLGLLCSMAGKDCMCHGKIQHPLPYTGDEHTPPQAAAGNARFVQIPLDLVEKTLPHF